MTEDERARLQRTAEAFRVLRSLPKVQPLPKVDLSHFSQAHKNALAVFPAIHKQFADHAKQLAAFQRTINQISPAVRASLQELTDGTRKLRSALSQFQIPPQTLDVIREVARTSHRQTVLERIGLLPHPSTPFEMLDRSDETGTLKAELETFYHEQWGEIAEEIRRRTSNFDIDEEAKASLCEALSAHGNGHYRSVCRLLLPEIERVARVELLGKRLGTIKVDRVLGDLARHLSIRDTEPPGFYAVGLFKRLTDHLYMKIDSENLSKFESDPVPNRHAAIHGLIVYSTVWHSLNAVFMTDYTFQLVTALKASSKRPM